MPPGQNREETFYAIPGSEESACGHDAVRELGSDGTNQFFECVDCGSALVKQRVVSRAETPPSDLGSVDPRMTDLLDDIDAYHAGEPTSFSPGRSKSVVSRLASAWRRLVG
jgi:hypothetical protein